MCSVSTEGGGLCSVSTEDGVCSVSIVFNKGESSTDCRCGLGPELSMNQAEFVSGAEAEVVGV